MNGRQREHSPRFWRGFAFTALVAGCSNAEDGATGVQEESRKLVGFALGEQDPELGERLQVAGREQGWEAEVSSSLGIHARQSAQLDELIARSPDCVVLFPTTPSLLLQARGICRRQAIPLLVVLRGEGQVEAWLGVAGDALTAELGRQAADLLKDRGVELPRAYVVEDQRWPETQSRVESILQGIGEVYDSIDIRSRLTLTVNAATTAEQLRHTLTHRPGEVHLIIAGDTWSTRAAVEGYRGFAPDGDTVIVGVTRDSDGIPGSRTTLLATYRLEELVEKVVALTSQLMETGPQELAVCLELMPPRTD